MQELKPCPFCDCTPYRYIQHGVPTIGCVSCGIHVSGKAGSEADLEARWNQRVMENKMICTCVNWVKEEPYLDSSVDMSEWKFCPYCSKRLKGE